MNIQASLAHRVLCGAGATAVVVMLATTLVAFAAFQSSLERREMASLGRYVAERATREDRQFMSLARIQRGAVEAFKLRRAHLRGPEIDRLFDRYFEAHGDGTFRTRAPVFDGAVEPCGDFIYGVGGFAPQARRLVREDKRTLLAALQVVSRFGEAESNLYDNVYFFTPQARLVMFAPRRPDRLMFYRATAPPTLDISRLPMARLATTRENPARVSRCTGLQHLISDPANENTGVACVTPVDMDGRLVGAFGSSLQLGGFFRGATTDTLPESVNMITTSDASLIAFPGIGGARPALQSRVSEIERRYALRGVLAAIRRHGGESGVVKSPDGSRIVAFGRLRGPEWYFLVVSPASAIAWDAARSAIWVLALGLLAAGLQTAAVVTIARRLVVQPLTRLASSAARPADSPSAEIGAIEARHDEIGVLARSLRDERRRTTGVLASLEDRVHERTAELESALQEKSRFLANMSHELRTPLNGIVAVSEALLDRVANPQNRELVQLIAASGRVLEQVLTDVLDASKLEAGQMQLELTPFEPAIIVRQVADLHRAAAQAKGLSLSIDIEPAACGCFLGDPLRLTQILSNLLNNAVKFTQAGQVSIVVVGGPEGLTFRVDDTGIGFDPAMAERLFERFEQADASITRRFGGTGLGLAICRSLAALMGGEVLAQARAEGGASFTLKLPLARVEGQAPSAAALEISSLEGLRVLLAEDHPTNQHVVRLILESAGVVLEVVPDGELALAAVTRSDFDVVLMDMQMPVMDGLRATARIREREAARGAPRTPLIMLTANALPEHAEAARASGADLHLTKPFRPDTLLAAIAQVLTSPAQAQGESEGRTPGEPALAVASPRG